MPLISALSSALAIKSATTGCKVVGSWESRGTLGPRAQPSAMPNRPLPTTHTRPVTLAASGLHSQVTMGAIQVGDIVSWTPSDISAPPISGAVSRVRALGAMQFTVTP